MKEINKILCIPVLVVIFLNCAGVAEPVDKSDDVTSINPLSLEDCVVMSLRNGFDVKLAKLDLYVAETELMYSKAVFDTFLTAGAGYTEDKRQQLSVFSADDNQINEYYTALSKKLPTGTELSAELRDTRSWSNTSFISKNPSHTIEMLLSGRQPVARNFFGYVDRTRVSITEIAIENAGLDTKDRIESFISEVEKSYWDFVFTRRTLAIYKDMLKKAEDLYMSTKKNFDRGLQEEVDLVASEANLERIEAEYVLVGNNCKEAEENLKFLMNVKDGINFTPSRELDLYPVRESMADCLETAFLKRRDYLKDKKEVDKKGLELKMNSNLRWPEIDLVGTMISNGVEVKFNDAVDKASGMDNMYYYGGVEFSFPLENREARSQYIKSKNEKERAIVSLKKTERQIITEVGNAFRKVASLDKSLGHMKKTVELQSDKLKEEDKRFKYGRSSTKRIIDYQQDLLRAELEYAEFLLRHKEAVVDLYRSMNVILDEYKELV